MPAKLHYTKTCEQSNQGHYDRSNMGQAHPPPLLQTHVQKYNVRLNANGKNAIDAPEAQTVEFERGHG